MATSHSQCHPDTDSGVTCHAIIALVTAHLARALAKVKISLVKSLTSKCYDREQREGLKLRASVAVDCSVTHELIDDYQHIASVRV